GKRHAAPAPNIDVVEPDRFDTDLNFAVTGLCRRRNIAKFDFTIGDQRERAHRSAGRSRGAARAVTNNGFGSPAHAGSRVITRHTFWPPKPNELEIARVTRASRGTFGTTSSGIAGSGTWGLIVGGMRWCSSVRRLNTASTAPAAVRVCPIIDLFEEIGMTLMRSPKTVETPKYSILSFSGVEVPCALI